MTTAIFVTLFMAAWAFSVGHSFSIIKNYQMNFGWYVPAVFTGPFTMFILWAMVLTSDEMKTRRELKQMKTKQKLLEAKLEDDKAITRYLE
ncbi:hypothetical protein GWN63_03835 [Candidatus Bathyarchaeota archaeon]|nr:hypothetical protein [Candidatus Bathyarchaeota archaeon]NIR16241.1 hypothetical protein [Desulfobacterales bacterium]NIU81360.1 hypothetical protein [Candidatus Bathyarchaeota archaeon]NIV67946.1 hypothetical protein [Candidatus Bathyarchaeota archaeon]NIW34502.1 hypothetical protein [Candidatus Bathyarchaeota archaeon]